MNSLIRDDHKRETLSLTPSEMRNLTKSRLTKRRLNNFFLLIALSFLCSSVNSQALSLQSSPSDANPSNSQSSQTPSTISYVVANPLEDDSSTYTNSAIVPPEPQPISTVSSRSEPSDLSGGFGTLPRQNDLPMSNGQSLVEMNDDPIKERETTNIQPPTNDPGKRRQYIPPPGAPAILEPPAGLLGGVLPGGGFALAPAIPPPPPPPGTCPTGGAPLPLECDPKRPWPQCPPQSYCYATNTVDIGPYFCCPIWSTYGAAWRPATPFYNYAPPPPPNWPEALRMASVGLPPTAIGLPLRKSKKEQRFEEQETPLNSNDQKRLAVIMNDWMQRQQALENQEATKP